MQQKLPFFVLIALPALSSVSCDASLPAPADLAVPVRDLAAPLPDLSTQSDLSTQPDLSTCGVCLCGLTLYRATNASYPAVPGSATIVSDTCQTGITASALETSRSLKNDAMGNITIYAADNTTIIGTGPVRCNTGTLTAGPTVFSDGVCRFSASNKTDFTLTADNAFNITVTQSRSNSMSEPGQNCQQPATCTIMYKVSHKL